jgi:Cd2+/Zn2+-exporting ATPase
MATVKKYELQNLDCANCALKIEEGVKKLPGVKFASVNFATSSIMLDAEDVQMVSSEINRIDPQVQMHYEEQSKPKAQDDRKELIMIGVSVLLFAFGLVFNDWLSGILNGGGIWIVLGAAYAISGHRVLWHAVQNLQRKNWFDETFLMSISTLGAIAIGEIHEAVGVMLFYQIGEYIQERSVARSRNEIEALLAVRPETATVLRDGESVAVTPEQVALGEAVLVRPGEKIPLDGVVIEGVSTLDTSMLTGESRPVRVEEDDEVFAGTLNQAGVLKVEVTKAYNQSSISKMLELVQNAANRKAKTERFITRFAKVYSPIMVGLALLVAFVPPIVFPGEILADWVYRALVLLVISCPCALVISIPLGYFGGIGGASRRGVLVKGANFLDILADVETVVFDKTGTLTFGEYRVSEVVPVEGQSKDTLIYYANLAEAHSQHPVAISIRRTFGEPDMNKIDGAENIMDYEEIAGYGVRAKINGNQIIVGNDAFLHYENLDHTNCDVPGTVVHIVVDEDYLGYIQIEDQVRPNAKDLVQNLRSLGVKTVMMLSGDREDIAEEVSQTLGLDKFYGGLLPADKMNVLEDIMREGGGKVAFVGDGINDAPALARADVGVAMGAFGSDAAIETADVVLMADEIEKVADAITVGRRTRGIVWQNIGLAFAIKLIFIVLGVFGLTSMGGAVFADVGVTILAVLNATRVLR